MLFMDQNQLTFKIDNFLRFSAVWHAMYFDGSSGGVCRIGVITKDGIDRDIFFAPIDSVPTPSAAPTAVRT